MEFDIRDRVELQRGIVVTVTDKVDQSAPEVQETPDDICIGEDSWGRFVAFPAWEVVAIVSKG